MAGEWRHLEYARVPGGLPLQSGRAHGPAERVPGLVNLAVISQPAVLAGGHGFNLLESGGHDFQSCRKGLNINPGLKPLRPCPPWFKSVRNFTTIRSGCREE